MEEKTNGIVVGGVSFGENDKILTLSTCYGEDERMVVHAKLIKRETKK